MTNQCRRELIEKYEEVIERGEEQGHLSCIMDFDDLEDLLALLREDGLEWRASDSAGKHVASFYSQTLAEDFAVYTYLVVTITGPDGPPKSHTNDSPYTGIPEGVVI